MQHTPNIIKAAVAAAGGRARVAQALGVTAWAVTGWTRTARMPADKIRPLCALGSNVVTADQLLAYIEQHAAERVAA